MFHKVTTHFQGWFFYITPMNPRTDPSFLGRVEIPEYGLYAIREKYWKDGKEWIKQTLFKSEDDTKIGHQATWAPAQSQTIEGLLDNLLWKVDPEASKTRHEDKEASFYSGPYARYSIGEKASYWINKSHFFARISLDNSPDRGAILILNREWMEQNSRWNTPLELEGITQRTMMAYGIAETIGKEMLARYMNDPEWRFWADQAQ